MSSRWGRKRLCGLVALVALSSTGAAAFANTPVHDIRLCASNPQEKFARVKPGPYKVGSFTVADLESKHDGVNIQVGVLRPIVPKTTKVPVIAFASPYFYQDLHDANPHECVPRLSENFVTHGYAVAFIAARGSAGSGGCSDFMGRAERSDLDQAVTWLGTQKWSSGSVGMIGVSYDGGTPWEVAGEGNRYLKTIVPISGVNDLYDLMFGGGVVEWRAPYLSALFYTDGFGPYSGRDESDWGPGAVCPEAWSGFVASVESTLTGARDHFEYWAARNSRPLVEKNYRGSIFLVQGLQDWNVDPGHQYPWVWRLEDKGFEVKHLLGQWAHAWPDWSSPGMPTARYDWADILLKWFDRYLKGENVRTGPAVEVQDSDGNWRRASAWPPANAETTRFYLGAGGTLSQKKAGETEPVAIFPNPGQVAGPALLTGWDPSDCTTCAAFATGPVEDEFRFAGRPSLRLEVTPTGPGGHISAWLFAENDEGERERVGWGQVDLRYPKGGETPQVVVPGHPMSVRLSVQPLDVVLEKGSRLILALSQGAFANHLPTPVSFPLVATVGDGNGILQLESFDVPPKAFFSPPMKPRPPLSPI